MAASVHIWWRFSESHLVMLLKREVIVLLQQLKLLSGTMAISTQRCLMDLMASLRRTKLMRFNLVLRFPVSGSWLAAGAKMELINKLFAYGCGPARTSLGSLCTKINVFFKEKTMRYSASNLFFCQKLTYVWRGFRRTKKQPQSCFWPDVQTFNVRFKNFRNFCPTTNRVCASQSVNS